MNLGPQPTAPETVELFVSRLDELINMRHPLGSLVHRPHTEQGYRACLGLMRLDREYGAERLEPACDRALSIRAPHYKSISSILASSLDRHGTQVQLDLPAMPTHENVRGPDHYN